MKIFEDFILLKTVAQDELHCLLAASQHSFSRTSNVRRCCWIEGPLDSLLGETFGYELFAPVTDMFMEPDFASVNQVLLHIHGIRFRSLFRLPSISSKQYQTLDYSLLAEQLHVRRVRG